MICEHVNKGYQYSSPLGERIKVRGRRLGQRERIKVKGECQ